MHIINVQQKRPRVARECCTNIGPMLYQKISNSFNQHLNPLLHSEAYIRRSAKILILIHERRDYESVDEKSLS